MGRGSRGTTQATIYLAISMNPSYSFSSSKPGQHSFTINNWTNFDWYVTYLIMSYKHFSFTNEDAFKYSTTYTVNGSVRKLKKKNANCFLWENWPWWLVWQLTESCEKVKRRPPFNSKTQLSCGGAYPLRQSLKHCLNCAVHFITSGSWSWYCS